MRALLRALGEPQERLRAVVVGGSVGKGTTAAFLAQMLRASGARVGCYSGPHLHSWRERFTINGARISPAEFTALVKRVHETISENDFALRKFAPPGLYENDFAHSTFEMNTALALSWFAERAVDFVVLEAGIGGRWDAVNAAARAAPSALAILTPIEREHANLLGGSLTSIAAHKAGLIPTGGWAISAPQTPAVAAILREEAEQRGAALVFVGDGDEEPFALARALAEKAFRLLRPTQPMPEAGLIPPPPAATNGLSIWGTVGCWMAAIRRGPGGGWRVSSRGKRPRRSAHCWCSRCCVIKMRPLSPRPWMKYATASC